MIIYSYKAKYNDGMTREIGKFQVYSLNEKLEILSKALIDSINYFEEGIIYNRDHPKIFTNNIVNASQSRNYKDFVKNSAMISLVFNDNTIRFQTLESSKIYIGYSPYNQDIEEFDLSKKEIEKVMSRIIEILKEVVSKY